MGFWYWCGYTFAKILGKCWLSYRVMGKDKLKQYPNGLLIVSNHVSFLDPPLVGIAFDDPIYYFARKTLFDHPVTNFLFTRMNALPVNQEKPELSILKKIISLLKEGEKVLIFPEGERSFDGNMNMEGQPGVGMIVTKSRVPVVPVRLFGAEVALPRGSKKLHRHPVTLVVGDPIDLDDLISDKTLSTKDQYQAIANRIMTRIADLECP